MGKLDTLGSDDRSISWARSLYYLLGPLGSWIRSSAPASMFTDYTPRPVTNLTTTTMTTMTKI